VAVVVLALCCGGGFVGYRYVNNKAKDVGSPTTSTAPSAGSTTPGGSSSSPSTRTTAPSTPAKSSNGGADPDTFVKGDCFTNQGTDDSPKLAKVPCTTKDSYEVVFKVPFTADKERCKDPGVGDYDASYTHDESPGTLGDYVLCLKHHT